MDKELARIHESKRSQVTIFVILGMILVVLIGIFFAARNPPKLDVVDENNPQAYIESCVREATEEAIGILSKQGGDIEPKGSVQYNGIDIVYLCYTNSYYQFCTNQRPMLAEHIEKEITNFIIPIVADCFNILETELGSRYNIETSDMKLVTRLYPNQVSVEIFKKFKMYREDNVREFDHFKMNMIHPIYNFAEIANEIVNQEAQYCNFDDLGFMILYPRFDVKSSLTGTSDTIYVIRERTTNQEFQFATKSCWLPPGF